MTVIAVAVVVAVALVALFGAVIVAAADCVIANRHRRRQRLARLVAELQLQQITRNSMQRMLAEARQHQSQPWQ